ncbi:6-carboxyhexanoate--CoA ligase [Candidatus Magnetoovum chiemensis]|nr:6-carboxyhexanoate--CoA ligase [Candidatus Magnetoovum chiemensis]
MLYSIKMRAAKQQAHICGAEGIFKNEDIPQKASEFINRALQHKPITPDKINLTIETIKTEPLKIKTLPLVACNCKTSKDALEAVQGILKKIGIDDYIIKKALSIIYNEPNLRGASILNIQTGQRLEKDIDRGVRASMLGISDDARENLILQLSTLGLTHHRVIEALIIASKAASHKSICAELCASDDPDYTTGYVSSKHFGYVRIPNIKSKGSTKGGRVFFALPETDRNELTAFLEETPVMINDISLCKGALSLNEILCAAHC